MKTTIKIVVFNLFPNKLLLVTAVRETEASIPNADAEEQGSTVNAATVTPTKIVVGKGVSNSNMAYHARYLLGVSNSNMAYHARYLLL